MTPWLGVSIFVFLCSTCAKPPPELMTIPPDYNPGLPSFLGPIVDPRFPPAKPYEDPRFTPPPGYQLPTGGMSIPTTLPTPIELPTNIPFQDQDKPGIYLKPILFLLIWCNVLMLMKLCFLLWRMKQLRKLILALVSETNIPLSDMQEEEL